MRRKSSSTESEQPDAGSISEAFSEKIKQEDELLYGVALFFECISLLNSGQDAVVETYRKQFRNIIQSGKEAIADATALLEQLSSNPELAQQAAAFEFQSCSGHPDPEGLKRRAIILAQEYARLFPDRPKEQVFKKEELMQLIEAAAVGFE